MSGKIMGGVWDLNLPRNKSIVLLAMADHADHNGDNVRPSFGLVAWKTGYSYRQVIRIVKELEADGILVPLYHGKNDGKPNEYHINLDAGAKKQPYKPKKNIVKPGYDTIESDPIGGYDTIESDQGVTSESHTGCDTQESHDPSLNRQNKPSANGAKPEKPVQPHIAIIDAWYDGLPAEPISRQYPRNVRLAKAILKKGYTPEQVKKFTTVKSGDPYWHGKQVSLEAIEKDLPQWVKQHVIPGNGAKSTTSSEATRAALLGGSDG